MTRHQVDAKFSYKQDHGNDLRFNLGSTCPSDTSFPILILFLLMALRNRRKRWIELAEVDVVFDIGVQPVTS